MLSFLLAIAVRGQVPCVVPSVKSTSDAFAAHGAAILLRSVDNITRGYSSNAALNVFNVATKTAKSHRGTAEIAAFWKGLLLLFDLSRCGGSEVFTFSEDAGNVFLTWPCAGCGIVMGSDSVHFDGEVEAKITQHNVIFDWPGVNVSSWNTAPSSKTCGASAAKKPPGNTPDEIPRSDPVLVGVLSALGIVTMIGLFVFKPGVRAE